MKIYNWIDSFFSTKEKRRLFLWIVTAIYWLWQNAWQSYLFIELFKLSDYTSLFRFLENMNIFTQSFLVRMLYVIVMKSSSYSLIYVIGFILSQLTVFDIFFLISTALLYESSTSKRKWHVLMISLLLMICCDIIIIVFGYQQVSLTGVVRLLKYLAIGSLVVEIAHVGLLLIGLVENIKHFVEINICS